MKNINEIERLFLEAIADMNLDDVVEYINMVREITHRYSPFKNEPVDLIRWVKSEKVVANDYNPNKVAPPEMELLEISIMNDGYTQPIVTWPHDDVIEVIDGFHRNRVGKESSVVKSRVKGYLPTVAIRSESTDKKDRIASTIRHNRARGKHQINAMSEIVIELKNRNWKNSRIARELGMDEDEILRLLQITGLKELFKDDDFSRAWVSDDTEVEYEILTDQIPDEVLEETRTANTSDPERIFHTFEKWECHKAGFYKPSKDGMTKEQCKLAYAEFLIDDKRFRKALRAVISKWKHSCEHYLTNKAMNRIAWLGQAAMCYATGVPSVFCSGFNLLTDDQKEKANQIALEFLNKWLKKNGLDVVNMESALSQGRQAEIY